MGFPGSSAGKESSAMQETPGWGRSPGEGMGYPLQYSWALLVAQTVKNLPANTGDTGDKSSVPGLGRSP